MLAQPSSDPPLLLLQGQSSESCRVWAVINSGGGGSLHIQGILKVSLAGAPVTLLWEFG